MSLAILFYFLCAQHVSDINISIIRSLRLFCWITTLVVLVLVRCVLEFRCGWVGVVSVLQASDGYVYWNVQHCDSWVKGDQLEVTSFIISLFNAQHVSDVNTSILRNLRLLYCVKFYNCPKRLRDFFRSILNPMLLFSTNGTKEMAVIYTTQHSCN